MIPSRARTKSITNQRIAITGKPLPVLLRLLFIINIALCVYTLVAYISVHISPARIWAAGFLTLSIPVAMLGHFLFLAFWIFFSPVRLFASLMIILMGFPLFGRTLAINPGKKSISNSKASTFQVLSFNARMFNTYLYYKDKSSPEPRASISWVSQHEADIKCIQEFYNLDDSRVFNTISKIAEKGNYQYYMTPLFKGLSGKRGFVGVAIFSRFPIINSGDIVFGENTLNKGVFVDVVIKQDTVRIFNVHLHSMSIKADSLFNNEGYQDIKETYTDTFRRLRKGFAARGTQISILEKHIRASPYKVILCGDFNDIPYSYTYQRLRRHLHNAFEEAGNGFGFTYNGKLFFLRIDNQFFDPRLSILNFRTLRDIPYSDHFPVLGTYSLEPTNE